MHEVFVLMSTIQCPRCKAAPTDTVTTAPYIRGFLVAYTYGTKRFVGCNSCVKKQLAGEVGVSLLTGWFSITSVFVNPMCILWNGLRVPFVKSNPDKVQELMAELGITTGVDIAKVAACLAASMVAADGKVEEEEIVVAVGIGQQLVEGFTPELFMACLENVQSLPSTTQMAGLLADQLECDGKVAIMEYLIAIAASDGVIDQSEVNELKEAAFALGVTIPDLKAGPVPQE